MGPTDELRNRAQIERLLERQAGIEAKLDSLHAGTSGAVIGIQALSGRVDSLAASLRHVRAHVQ